MIEDREISKGFCMNNNVNAHGLKRFLEPVPVGFPEDLFVDRIHCCICGIECMPPEEVSGFSFLIEMDGVFDFSGHKFSLYRCDKCGIGITFPQVAARHIGLLYEKPEPRNFINDGALISRIRQFFFRREARWWLKWFEAGKIIERGAGARSRHFLDFGTGSGLNVIAFANVLSDSWRVWACDFSTYPPPSLLGNARISYLSHKTLEESGQKFDCIHLRHVLEHVPDPLSLLLQMRELLSAYGSLFIEIPSLYPALHPFTMRYFRGLFQSSPPYHCYHFSHESLRALLLRAGFSWEIRTADIPVLGRLLQSRTGCLFAGRKYPPLFVLGIILYPLQWLYVQLMGVKPIIRVLARKVD